MSKFKVGDLIIAKKDVGYLITNDKAKHPFVVQSLSSAAWQEGDMLIRVHPDDDDEIEGIGVYPVDSKHFELAQPYINEQKLKKVLGL